MAKTGYLGAIITVSAAAVLAVLAAVVVALVAPPKPAEAAVSCSGKDVYPWQNLARVAELSAAGTTFCVHDGTYSVLSPVKVEDNDRFVGVYTDSTRPALKASQALQVFDARGSDGAVIEGLQVSGATGGNYCEPGCGQGIRGGDNLTVRNARLTNNKNNGIGGVGPGLLVENSVIDRNGSYSFTILDGGSSSAAGIKSAQDGLTVRNSRITDNYWSGVWCDGFCEKLTVEGSTLTGNGKAGIQDEISEGPAVIRNNTIKNNGVLPEANRHAGIVISNSANVDAYGNTFGGNVGGYGVQVIEYYRSDAPEVTNVVIRDNTMSGDVIVSSKDDVDTVGCTLLGLTCSNNV